MNFMFADHVMIGVAAGNTNYLSYQFLVDITYRPTVSLEESVIPRGASIIG